MKLWPGILVALALMGTGFCVAWAIWGRPPAPKISDQASLHTQAPLIPVPAVDSGQQSFPPPKSDSGLKPNYLAIDTLTKRLALSDAQVKGMQKVNEFYRKRLDSCLSASGLPHIFVAVKDTVLHKKDSVVIDLLKGTADFFHFGIQEEPTSPGIGRIPSFSAPKSIFEVELTVWVRGAPSGAINAWNPFRPAWWVPGKVGFAAKADGNKGLVLSWPIP